MEKVIEKLKKIYNQLEKMYQESGGDPDICKIQFKLIDVLTLLRNIGIDPETDEERKLRIRAALKGLHQ